ncbi:MAG: hypothetical protein R2941_25315 [Desulfobacterales bacterium]
MENLERKFRKTVKTCRLPQPAGRKKRWTVLLVEDSGQTIRITRPRTWIAVCLFLFAAVSATAVFTYCRYQTAAEENRSLPALQDKPENPLLAQSRSVPDADSQSQKAVHAEAASPSPSGEEEKSRKPDAQADRDKAGESAPPSSAEKGADAAAQEKAEKETVSEAEKGASPSLSPRVSAEDFSCSFSGQRESLNIRFHIRNTDPDAGPVSGQVFVILKPEKESSRKWLLLPEGKTVSGKLPDDAAGESFSISRFRSVEMTAKEQKNPDAYKTATVIAVDEKENLMLEETFLLSGEKSS